MFPCRSHILRLSLLTVLLAVAAQVQGQPVAAPADTTASRVAERVSAGGDRTTGTSDLYGGDHHLAADRELTMVPRPGVAGNEMPLLLLIVYLASIALARFFFPGYITRTAKAALGLHAFYASRKEGSAVGEVPGVLLKMNFLLVVSLLGEQTLSYTAVPLPWAGSGTPAVFLLLFAFFFLFYPVKWLVVRFLGWVFNTQHASILYFENLLTMNQLAGLVLAPFVFFNAFNPVGHLMYAAWIALLILALAKVFRGAVLKYRTTGYSLYYLILYLCAIEIAPLMLIGEAASRYFL